MKQRPDPKADPLHVEAFREVIDCLREHDPARSSDWPDISGEVLGQVRAPLVSPMRVRRERCVRIGRVWARAAGVLILVGASLFFARRWLALEADGDAAGMTLAVDSSLEQDMRWLCGEQRADGAWVARGDGSAPHMLAVHGLALMALVRHRPDEELAPFVRRAAQYLAGIQREDGSFGSPGDEQARSHTHAIATLALMRAFQQTGEAAWQPYIRRALDYSVSRQGPHGGWGDDVGEGAVPGTFATAWQLHCLHVAMEHGWSGYEDAFHRGMRWLARAGEGTGSFDYLAGHRARDEASGETTRILLALLGQDHAADTAVPPDWLPPPPSPSGKHLTVLLTVLALDNPRGYLLDDWRDGLAGARKEGARKHQGHEARAHARKVPLVERGMAGDRVYSTSISLLAR